LELPIAQLNPQYDSPWPFDVEEMANTVAQYCSSDANFNGGRSIKRISALHVMIIWGVLLLALYYFEKSRSITNGI
jgi:hypothetical protein